MNAILIAIVIGLASGMGGFLYGVPVGRAKAVSEQKKLEEVAEAAAEKVADRSANAISALKVVKSTVIQKGTHEIRTNTVYTDCRHSDGMLRNINEALTGRPDAAAEGVVPKTNPAPADGLRGDDAKAAGSGFQLSRVPGLNWLGGVTK